MDEATEEANTTSQSVESIKELGNAAIKDGKYEEAMLHYTHGIKRDPKNYALYSNRSFAFLKLKQYSLAMDDALQTISLNPEWAKGYFRRGEVEFATGHYIEAAESYEIALRLKPDDQSIFSSVEKAQRAVIKEKTEDAQVPWVGAGIGIVLGVIILISDYMLTANPTHPLVMVFATIAISLLGYFVAKFIHSARKSSKKSELQPNKLEDPEGIDEDDELGKNGKTRNRYTKSQARQRFRKGKM